MGAWTCPACGRGVAPDVKTCDHGGDLKGRDFAPYFPPPMYLMSPTIVPWEDPFRYIVTD